MQRPPASPTPNPTDVELVDAYLANPMNTGAARALRDRLYSYLSDVDEPFDTITKVMMGGPSMKGPVIDPKTSMMKVLDPIELRGWRENPSSLKRWVRKIALNATRDSARREHRSVPLNDVLENTLSVRPFDDMVDVEVDLDEIRRKWRRDGRRFDREVRRYDLVHAQLETERAGTLGKERRHELKLALELIQFKREAAADRAGELLKVRFGVFCSVEWGLDITHIVAHKARPFHDPRFEAFRARFAREHSLHNNARDSKTGRVNQGALSVLLAKYLATEVGFDDVDQVAAK